MNHPPIICQVQHVNVLDKIVMRSLKQKVIEGMYVGKECVTLWLEGHKKIDLPLDSKVRIVRSI